MGEAGGFCYRPSPGSAYFEDFSDFLLLLSFEEESDEEESDFLSSFFESLESFDSLLELSPRITTAARTVRLLGVVSNVPARAFELHGRRRNYLLDNPAALRALLGRLIGKLNYFFEAMAALFTEIFVKWHGLRRLVTSKTPIDSRGERCARQFRALNGQAF